MQPRRHVAPPHIHSHTGSHRRRAIHPHKQWRQADMCAQTGTHREACESPLTCRLPHGVCGCSYAPGHVSTHRDSRTDTQPPVCTHHTQRCPNLTSRTHKRVGDIPRNTWNTRPRPTEHTASSHPSPVLPESCSLSTPDPLWLRPYLSSLRGSQACGDALAEQG